MKYKNIKPAKFLSRPNRFIANIEIDGKTEICHVKNTGRCKELLVPNASIFVEEVNSDTRKTKYDLISVYKGEKLVNIDSQVPNKVFYDWVKSGNLFEKVTLIKPEYIYKNSRFDFYIETEGAKSLVEVKGVTLEQNGIALFPDAPTERGLKHIRELCESMEEGYDAYIVFIIQMKDVLYFTPNIKTHRAFAEALIKAEEKGVKIIALDSYVTKDSIIPGDLVEVRVND